MWVEGATIWVSRKRGRLAYYLYTIQTMEWIRIIWEDSPNTGVIVSTYYSDSIFGFYYYSRPSLCFLSTEKKGSQSLGRSRGGFTTKIHVIAGGPDFGMDFVLSPWNSSDLTTGMEIVQSFSWNKDITHLAMDKGYSSYGMVKLCHHIWIEPVVPPKRNHKFPWLYNKNVYLYRNEIERFFNRIKNFRRVATRYDELDFAYSWFVALGMICLLTKVLC